MDRALNVSVSVLHHDPCVTINGTVESACVALSVCEARVTADAESRSRRLGTQAYVRDLI